MLPSLHFSADSGQSFLANKTLGKCSGSLGNECEPLWPVGFPVKSTSPQTFRKLLKRATTKRAINEVTWRLWGFLEGSPGSEHLHFLSTRITSAGSTEGLGTALQRERRQQLCSHGPLGTGCGPLGSRCVQEAEMRSAGGSKYPVKVSAELPPSCSFSYLIWLSQNLLR